MVMFVKSMKDFHETISCQLQTQDDMSAWSPSIPKSVYVTIWYTVWCTMVCSYMLQAYTSVRRLIVCCVNFSFQLTNNQDIHFSRSPALKSQHTKLVENVVSAQRRPNNKYRCRTDSDSFRRVPCMPQLSQFH